MIKQPYVIFKILKQNLHQPENKILEYIMVLREIEDRKHLKVFKSNKQKCANSERDVNYVYQRK